MKTKILVTMGTMAVATCLQSSAADRFPSNRSGDQRDSSRDRISHSTNSPSYSFSSHSRHHASDLKSLERSSRLIGSTVQTSDKERAGQIKDIVADLESGRVLYAVVSTSRIPGLGDDLALPPGVFTDSNGDTVHLNISRDALKDAPKFTSDMDRPEQLGQASFVYQVHQKFNQSAWWQGANAPDTGKFNNVHKLSALSGMNVKNVSDQPVGEVNNVMVDLPAGRVAFIVLTPDKDLDLGNNYFALPPNALTLSSDQKTLVSNVDREKLSNSPSFSRNEWSKLSDRSFASSVYQHYGKQAYFDSGSTLAPTGRDTERYYENKDSSDKSTDKPRSSWDRSNRDREVERDRYHRETDRDRE